MGMIMPTIDPPAKITPLAAALRPLKLDEVIGQRHLVGPGMAIRKMADKKRAQSAIIWGPSGTGKTTIVRALAREIDALFYNINATSATVKELREIILAGKSRSTFAFVDEIHRFSKSQQDVLLPAVEDGTIIMFGATTEKPKFAVNSTILSRCIVLETKPLDAQEMIDLVKRVKGHYKAKGRPIKIDQEAAKWLINRASGDARKAITALETCIEILSDDDHITLDHVNTAIPDKHIVFDATGNDHFDLAHCYQEAIQHSDADGALYWLGKWIASGEDPAYICRRMLITAFEDCAGNPHAWLAAMAACYTVEKTGLPECMIPMSVATCEMARSERNKTGYNAIKDVMSDIENREVVHVPPELRAGTRGYTHAVKKVYLREWKRDATFYRPATETPMDELHRSVTYAIGYEEAPDSFVMAYGPTLQLQEMLDVLPEDEDRPAYIIKFHPVHDRSQDPQTEKVFGWVDGKWKKWIDR